MALAAPLQTPCLYKSIWGLLEANTRQPGITQFAEFVSSAAEAIAGSSIEKAHRATTRNMDGLQSSWAAPTTFWIGFVLFLNGAG